MAGDANGKTKLRFGLFLDSRNSLIAAHNALSNGLSQCNGEVALIWASDDVTAITKLADRLLPCSGDLYATGAGWTGLSSRLRSLDAAIIKLPKEEHIRVLIGCLSLPAAEVPHIFSMNYPTTSAERLTAVVKAYLKVQSAVKSTPQWMIAESSRFETSVNKVISVTGELGRLKGGELQMTGNIMDALYGTSDDEICQCLPVTAVALMKRIFDREIVGATIADVEESVSGIIEFEENLLVSISLTPSSSVATLSVSVWGENGKLELTNCDEKGVILVQRQIGTSIEQSSRHAVTGLDWSMREWFQRVSDGADIMRSPQNHLADLLVASALTQSKGTPIVFTSTS